MKFDYMVLVYLVDAEKLLLKASLDVEDPEIKRELHELADRIGKIIKRLHGILYERVP